MNNKLRPYIFTQNINSKNKSVVFSNNLLHENTVGETKYFPPLSKEWINTVYLFNYNNLKNFSIYDTNLNKIIKSFFDASFTQKLFYKKYMKSREAKFLSSNKVFVSKAEIKHTSNKAIITIYSYNIQELALKKKIRKLKEKFFKIAFQFLYIDKNQNIYSDFFTNIKYILYKKILLIRRYKFKFNLNQYKFEEKFMSILARILSNLYKKSVEFNIIKLRSIILNTDLLTKFITLKIRNIRLKGKKYKGKKTNPTRPLHFILHRIILPKINIIKERSKSIKNVNFNLLENKYKNLHLGLISQKNWENKFLGSEYSYFGNNDNTSYTKLNDFIFKNIKYKNINGVRLEVKGRLTTRYRADKSIFRLRRKGGLQTIDSSYKGLSSVVLRGYVKPNLEYSAFTSTRRIGAFAVRG
jgi:hypothetical protein